MIELRIGIQTVSLRQPLRKALVTASQLEADAVEIDARTELRPKELTGTGLRQFRKILDDLNLKVSAIRFSTRRGYDDPEDLDRRVAATKEAMRMAYDLGASTVINHVGRVPSEEGLADEADPVPRERWQSLIEVLTDLGQFGQRTGSRLAADTGSEPGEDLARLLAETPEHSIGVNFSPAGFLRHNFSPRDAIRVLGPWIAHVHVNDAVRDRSRGHGLAVPIGRGMADFPEILGALEEHDYRGYLTIERSGADDPIFEAGQAVKFLRSL